MVDIICDHGERDGTENNESYLANPTYVYSPAPTVPTPPTVHAPIASISLPDFHTRKYNDHIEVGKKNCPKILTEFQQQFSRLKANYPAHQQKYVDIEIKDLLVLHDRYCVSLSDISNSIKSPNSSLYTSISGRIKKNDTTYYY